MVATLLCCRPLRAATVMVYSVPGSRSVKVMVVASLGTVSCSTNTKFSSLLTTRMHTLYLLVLYLRGDARGGGVGDLVMVDRALDQAPHHSDGVVSGGRHGQVHRYIQT